MNEFEAESQAERDLEEQQIPSMAEVGYIAKEKRYTYAPGCGHMCSGNCRRIGCNCECGEFHGFYEND